MPSLDKTLFLPYDTGTFFTRRERVVAIQAHQEKIVAEPPVHDRDTIDYTDKIQDQLKEAIARAIVNHRPQGLTVQIEKVNEAITKARYAVDWHRVKTLRIEVIGTAGSWTFKLDLPSLEGRGP